MLGRESGDVVFTEDPFLSRRHAAIRVLGREPASRAPLAPGAKPAPDSVSFALVDLGSSNGSFLRIPKRARACPRRSFSRRSAALPCRLRSRVMDEGLLVTQPPQAPQDQAPAPATTAETEVSDGSPDVRVKLFARTDVGQVREHNEDNFLVADMTRRSRGLLEANRATAIARRAPSSPCATAWAAPPPARSPGQLAVDHHLRAPRRFPRRAPAQAR